MHDALPIRYCISPLSQVLTGSLLYSFPLAAVTAEIGQFYAPLHAQW